MQSLNTIVNRESLPVPGFHLDRFQDQVLRQLHLEFFFERCRFLITPSFRHIATGEASRAEEQQLMAILTQRQELLEQLKRRLVCGLALHSALLETNSYFISVNEHLLIARFVGRGAGFEVKLYTLRPEDLPARYADKIYLGRDLLMLDGPGREQLALPFMRDSLREQLVKLERRIATLESEAALAELRRDFLDDLHEQADEFARGADALLATLPKGFPAKRPPESELLELNHAFRELKHTLIEADDVLVELEARLFARGSQAARYVTKLRKDVTNDVNYIMLKVNGRISDAINRIAL